MDKAVTFSIINRYSSEQGLIQIEDPMIIEVGLDIFINEQFYKKIYCSPINIDELIIGSLAFDNMINSVKDVHELHIKKMELLLAYKSLIRRISEAVENQQQKSRLVPGILPGL